MGEGKKYAVLLCAEASEYVKKRYGGYFGVFVGLLGEEGETWKVYKVAAGEFPSDDEVDELDGFVITGSCSDAHANDAWICRLVFLLKKLESMKKKMLGICFGHQILGRVIGGKTGRAKPGWDIGYRNVNVLPFSTLSSLNLPSQLKIIQCHRDEVKELPPKAEVIGWSDRTGIEMFRYGDHIMGIQGHPEYNNDILQHLLSKLVQRSSITEAAADEIKRRLIGQEADKETWRKLCTGFLKGRL